MLTYEQVREYFNYDQETGVLTWKITKASGACKGYQVGNLTERGYRRTQVNGRTYAVQRIIWLYVYGSWPKHYIDHINGIRDDNRLCNLREATPRENQQNSKAHRNGKLVGSRKSLKSKKFNSCIKVNGRGIHLGSFDTEQEASNAYFQAYEKIKRGEKIKGAMPRGYYYIAKTNKYRVQYKTKGHMINAGFFDSSELAIKARTEVIKQVKLGVPLWEYMPKKISYNPMIDRWVVKCVEFNTVMEAISHLEK